MKEQFVSEIEAERLTGYSRSSLLKKRQAGKLPFEREKTSGRVKYKLTDLREICGLVAGE